MNRLYRYGASIFLLGLTLANAGTAKAQIDTPWLHRKVISAISTKEQLPAGSSWSALLREAKASASDGRWISKPGLRRRAI